MNSYKTIPYINERRQFIKNKTFISVLHQISVCYFFPTSKVKLTLMLIIPCHLFNYISILRPKNVDYKKLTCAIYKFINHIVLEYKNQCRSARTAEARCRVKLCIFLLDWIYNSAMGRRYFRPLLTGIYSSHIISEETYVSDKML